MGLRTLLWLGLSGLSGAGVWLVRAWKREDRRFYTSKPAKGYRILRGVREQERRIHSGSFHCA